MSSASLRISSARPRQCSGSLKDDDIRAGFKSRWHALLGGPLCPQSLTLTLDPQHLTEWRLGLPQGFQHGLRDEYGLLHSTRRAYVDDLVLIWREQPMTLGNAFQSADLAGLLGVVLQLLLAPSLLSAQ